MRVTKKKETPGKPGRRYIPRPCEMCGAEACCAMQVRLRRIGKRSTYTGPRMMFSGSVLLCGACSKRPQAFGSHVLDYAAELSARTFAPPKNRGPQLFSSQVVN